MTQIESDIMKDAYYFLRDHYDPPHGVGKGAAAFWYKAANDLIELGRKYEQHPLAIEVFCAVYAYIEKKAIGSA